MKLRILWILSVFAGALAAPVWAQDADHGRISYSTDEALVRGEAEDEWSFAGINALILEGDRIWADESGAIELEFPGGYYVRLADGSEIEIESMPPSGLVRGWVGSFYVQRLPSSGAEFTFDTGAARFTFDPGTIARFDVLTDGATTLSVHQGRVGVFTDDGRVMDIGRGYRTYIDPGLLPSSPESFRSDEDTFDVWNATRVNYLADYSEPEPIRDTRSAAPIGTPDLGNYGEWVHVENNYYWRPTYVKDYVPYRYGYWSYLPRYGHVWVGYYPFDYVTAHYGYWHYNPRYGWLWSYEPVFAPARVVSISYGDVLFWAPATRYGYPVYGSHYDFRLGGFHFSLAFTSFAFKRHIFHRHHHHHYHSRPLHRHIIHNQPRNARPHLWDYHRRHDLAYWDNVRRNTSIGTWREEPAQRVRGFTQSEHRGDARTVARRLEDRRSRTEFRTPQLRRSEPDRRTSPLAGQRVARARDIESIRDRGMRVTPPAEVRELERAERRTTTRTPTVDRGQERAIRVDRAPATRERAISRESDNGRIDRTREIDRGVRTLPTDRGADARRERAVTPTDRLDRSRERITQPTDRGIDRGSITQRRETVRPDRAPSIDRTRTMPRSSVIDRSPRTLERSGRTVDSSRGTSQVIRPDRSTTRETVRTPTVQRVERPSMPSRQPVDRDTSRGVNNRIQRSPSVSMPSRGISRPEISRPAPEINRSAPSRMPSREFSRPAPSRGPAASSIRGNAPSAPSPRSVMRSAPSTRGGSARTAPSRGRGGSARGRR